MKRIGTMCHRDTNNKYGRIKMFKSNKEMLAEIMPDENNVLILKRDLQLHLDVLTKGTRVILRCGEICGWYDVISSNGCCIKSQTLYLNEMISEKGEYILSRDIPKYPQRIQKIVREYFMIDVDRTKEYTDFIEKKNINFGVVLFTLLWFIGLIAISVLGWIDGTWCKVNIPSLPLGSIATGIFHNVLFVGIWCFLGIMGIIIFGISAIESISKKKEEIIKKLLQ